MRLLPTIVRSVPRVLLAAAGAALPVVARAADAPPPTGPADVAADVDLADRFEALAELSFPRRVPTDAGREPVFAEQAALFRAAATLAPAEPRYARKLAEAVAYLPDVQPQFDALLAVLRLQPTDEFTWARLIDLHLSQMNAAGDKVKYLTAMERATSLPRTALAHAGAVHAQILVGQGRDSVARTLLTSVLTNNPLDADAVRLQYSLLPATAAPYARLQALLAVLRSNPLQPAYAAAVARLAADAGLAQESLPFYELSVGTASAQRQGDLATALDWGAEMYVGNRNADAYGWVRTVLGSSPRSSAAWYLDLLIVRSSGFPVARQDQDLQQATVALSNRVADAVNAVNAAVAGGPATRPAAGATGPRAATRPMDFAGPFPLPDASGAAAVIRRSDGADAATQPVADAVAVPPAARADFVEAVADLARLEIYFAKKPDAAAPLLDALAGVLPDNDPLLSQLRGLSDLVAGQSATPPDAAQLDRARGELLAVAATDPLAAIGLVQLLPRATPAEQQSADRAARKLLQDHAAGLVGAFVAEAVVNPRVQLVPNAQAVMPLQQALGSFPRDLLGAATQPQRLYTVHAEPVDVGRTVGEPLVARITLFNISPADLTVGDDGIIRPGLLVQLTTIARPDPKADVLPGVRHPVRAHGPPPRRDADPVRPRRPAGPAGGPGGHGRHPGHGRRQGLDQPRRGPGRPHPAAGQAVRPGGRQRPGGGRRPDDAERGGGRPEHPPRPPGRPGRGPGVRAGGRPAEPAAPGRPRRGRPGQPRPPRPVRCLPGRRHLGHGDRVLAPDGRQPGRPDPADGQRRRELAVPADGAAHVGVDARPGPGQAGRRPAAERPPGQRGPVRPGRRGVARPGPAVGRGRAAASPNAAAAGAPAVRGRDGCLVMQHDFGPKSGC